MQSIRRSAALVLLGSVLLPVLLRGQEREARLLDARTKYEHGMADLMQRAENRLRRLEVKAADRNAALAALKDKGELGRLEGMSELAAEAEQRRQRLLTALEECADAMVRHDEPGVDQILREQALWERIQDSLPWRASDLGKVANKEKVGLVWQPPKETSGGYRLKVLGTVEPGTVAVVELVLPVAKPEFGIVRVPVVEGRFDAMVTVGPEGDVALDLGVVRGKDAFGEREAEGGEVRITAATSKLQLTELQWKPFVARAKQAEVAVEKGKHDAAEPKQSDGGKSDVADPKKKAAAPQDAKPVPAPGKPAAPAPVPAAASKGALWDVGTKVEGWRTGNAKPQTPSKDCSLRGHVKSVEGDRIVFEVDERWRGPRGWVTPHREWVWKRVGVDQKTGEALLELVEARKDGRVVTLNPRGKARLKGNTMRGSYRVDFTNGTVHPDSDKAHDWILEIQPANGGK